MNIFLCFYILLKFRGRHPRSPRSNTSVSQPQSLPVDCLIRIICNKSWVQCILLLLWINLSPAAKCISMLPQKCSPFSPQIFFWVKSERIVSSSGTSVQPVAQLELISVASTSPAAIWPEIPDISVVCDQTLHCIWCSQPEALKELLNQAQGFWKYTGKVKKS